MTRVALPLALAAAIALVPAAGAETLPAASGPVAPLPAAAAAEPVVGAPSPAATPVPSPPLRSPAAGSAAPAAAPASAPASARVLVLERGRRVLRLLENGKELRRFPVAVGMPGWETPLGQFQVLNKIINPVWEHPEKGTRTASGPANPLGSRWIGFYSDCQGRKGWDGEQMLDVRGCVVAGFHGTPHRWTIGHAVSHGCVRLYDEDVRELYELVSLGTAVSVLP